MSRRQEHNMWSEESRGQQRGARGQQFKPEWTVIGVDVQSSTTTVSGEDQGGSEEPRNETAKSPEQWAKEVHQPVNDRAPARRSGMPEWSCETRWTEAASVRQNWMRVSEGIPACGA